jgi:hypothetical protein
MRHGSATSPMTVRTMAPARCAEVCAASVAGFEAGMEIGRTMGSNRGSRNAGGGDGALRCQVETGARAVFRNFKAAPKAR